MPDIKLIALFHNIYCTGIHRDIMVMFYLAFF